MSQIKTTVSEISTESPYSVNIEVSGFQITGDEHEPTGKALGPSPYDLLLAALAECTAMTVRWYAINKDWPLEQVNVTATHEKEGRADVFSKTVEVIGAELSAEQKEKLVEIAAKCPVHRTLLSDQVSIETHAKD